MLTHRSFAVDAQEPHGQEYDRKEQDGPSDGHQNGGHREECASVAGERVAEEAAPLHFTAIPTVKGPP